MAFMGQLVQWEDQLKGTIKPSKQLSDKENNAIKDIVQLTQQIKSWLKKYVCVTQILIWTSYSFILQMRKFNRPQNYEYANKIGMFFIMNFPNLDLQIIFCYLGKIFLQSQLTDDSVLYVQYINTKKLNTKKAWRKRKEQESAGLKQLGRLKIIF